MSPSVDNHFVPHHLDVRVCGQAPVDVHGLGVLFHRLFDDDLFLRIQQEHTFQQLTESTKPSTALRRGIYLTEVSPEQGGGLRFRLLRCSSNLSGPTENFRAADRHVVDLVNAAAAQLFVLPVSLNHVLAQVYDNHRDERDREKKARIGAHSDKTKDMQPEGVMAFCTFYDPAALARLDASPDDPYDRCWRGQSALTRLHFRRKRGTDEALVPEFSVTLYPGSVFFMPLSTNRRYTHAIRPAGVPVEHLPTRLGYVVRCSACEAVHRDGHTHLVEPGGLRPLTPMDPDGLAALRETYRDENTTAAHVRYGDVAFSMNAGDYLRPVP